MDTRVSWPFFFARGNVTLRCELMSVLVVVNISSNVKKKGKKSNDNELSAVR
jgi:hypothetical protein